MAGHPSSVARGLPLGHGVTKHLDDGSGIGGTEYSRPSDDDVGPGVGGLVDRAGPDASVYLDVQIGVTIT